jgi:hypothetical protein
VQTKLSTYIQQARVAGADPCSVELPEALHLGFDFTVVNAGRK